MNLLPNLSGNIPQRSAYTGKTGKGGASMENTIPHGDLDDLIYQEEWTASER